MLFLIDENTGKVSLSLVRDGCEQNYECTFSACPNPVCICQTIDIDLTFLPDQASGDLPIPCRSVGIDLDVRKTYTPPGKELSPAEKVLGDLLLSQLGDDDFKFLEMEHYVYKNRITEAADINEIEGYFDYEQVERDGLMYAYNGVLPYGDQFMVKVRGDNYFIADQFCLLPRCKCSDATLDLIPAGEDMMTADPWCSFRLTYAKKKWTGMEEFPPPIPLDEIRSAIEQQYPDFYKQLRVRHEKLKKIYLINRKKKYLPPPPVNVLKTGRNDPCPCGSGKKYKKCCLKATPPVELPDSRLDISSLPFPGKFKL